MSAPVPVKKVGLWKPPARALTASRTVAPAAGAKSERFLPEHFNDRALPTHLARHRGQVLVAEGDSWFDYPAPFRIDLLDALDDLNRPTKSIAYRGDTLENMVYGSQGAGGQLVAPDLDRLLELVTQLQPRGVLFSGGGNDVAGDEFAGFLNHISANEGSLRTAHVNYFIHTYVRKAYLHAAQRVWAVDPNIKFFTHGYANALPTGEGVGNIFGRLNLVGPWLKPACDAKGYDFTTGAVIVQSLLNEFNDMLFALGTANPNFIYVDFRQVIGNRYEDWANELHLTNDAIRVAALYLNDAITREIGPSS